MNTTPTCPSCGSATRRHCPETNLTCRWTKCARNPCQAILDPVNRRGYLLRNGKTVFVEWPR